MPHTKSNYARNGILLIALLFSSAVIAAFSQSNLTPLPKPLSAPDFSLEDMDGQLHRLSELRGRVVIINFWATWCPPCREEMPSMQRAWQALHDKGVVLLAVNVGEDMESVFRFSGSMDIGFPLLLDSDSKVADAWPVKGLPSTFVVDRQGRIVYRAIGGRAWDAPEILSTVLALAGREG